MAKSNRSRRTGPPKPNLSSQNPDTSRPASPAGAASPELSRPVPPPTPQPPPASIAGKESASPPLRPRFWKLVKLAFKKEYLVIIGTMLIAVSWYFENILIDKNKDIIDEINRMTIDYWRCIDNATENYWYSTFTYAHRKDLDSSTLNDLLVKATAQEIISIHSFRLYWNKMVFGDNDDSVKHAEELFRLGQRNLESILKYHDAERLHTVINMERKWLNESNKPMTALIARRIDKLNRISVMIRGLFILCIIIGSVLISANKVKEYLYHPS